MIVRITKFFFRRVFQLCCSILARSIFESEAREEAHVNEILSFSFDPIIPPFLFAFWTRVRKKNIGGTRSDATETLPRGKFRPG